VSYLRALTVVSELKTSQRECLKSLRQCELQPSLGSCLKSAYIARIAEMNFIGNPNRGLIGVEILGLAKRVEQNLLEIGAIAPNSPALEAAIKTGEYFSEINGTFVHIP
jgi:uncharacterized protein